MRRMRPSAAAAGLRPPRPAGRVDVADPRRTVALARTDLRVTRLGLGTAPLGGLYEPVEEDVARRVVHRARDHGLCLFDTAPLYGSGLAERRLGAALREYGRGEVVVSTKVGRLLERNGGAGESLFRGAPRLRPVFDFSYDGALRSLEASLERLGLDQVDVALIHDPDAHFDAALHGAYAALRRLRDEHVVGAIGVGMNQTDLLCRFAREAEFDCFLVAGRYTLLDTTAARELLPLCFERGIAVIAGGVFNSGILADARLPTFDYRPAPAQVLERVRRLRAVCERWQIPLAAAAVQLPLAHPAVTSVLVGCRSPRELDEDVRLVGLDIPPAIWDELRRQGLLDCDVPTP
jgi:D-threo-aldose 1-dehydrogenase